MNNKVLMSLVSASISAMVIAADPALVQAAEGKAAHVIGIKDVKPLNSEQASVSSDIQNQLDAVLNKKTPLMKLSENFPTLIENYGDKEGSIKDKTLKELKLSQDSDSTTYNWLGAGIPGVGQVCHAVCHTACHGACHTA